MSLPGWADIVRLMWTGGMRTRLDQADHIPVLRTGIPPVDPGKTALTWVGHATYLVRTEGATVLTDPVWSSRIPGVPRRLTPPGVAFDELPELDAVLITHNHYDHLDAPTMRRLNRDTALVVPAGLGAWFRRRRFTYVVELDWWESVRIAGLRFTFVPARHWSRRMPWDACRSLWGGWIITGARHRLYHAGDTGYGPHLAEIGQWYPGIDVAMLPIGAYEPQWFMREVHMTPEEAVLAARDVGARHMASMHWGTFALSREPVEEPVQRLREAWRTAGHDAAKLWDMAIGETRNLSERKR